MMSLLISFMRASRLGLFKVLFKFVHGRQHSHDIQKLACETEETIKHYSKRLRAF
jgi:hypothetical protein